MKFGMNRLGPIVIYFGLAQVGAQQLKWETSIDSAARFDYYIPDPNAVVLNYQTYSLPAGTNDKIVFLDVETGKTILSIPRPISLSSCASCLYWVTQKWADADDGWEILIYGTIDTANFALYDGDQVVLKGKGYASWATNGSSTGILVRTPSYYGGYKFYEFRKNLPVNAGGPALTKRGTGNTAWIVISSTGPEYLHGGMNFNSLGQVKP